MPLDKDNDLVRVEGREGIAAGETTDLQGRVLDPNGQPVEGALVEIWQCDANGRYTHRLDDRRVARDPNFQGYGRFETTADGRYGFRTIKPVPYPGRAPHIHVAVRVPGSRPLVTQMYVRGAPENQWDWLLNGVSDDAARERLISPISLQAFMLWPVIQSPNRAPGMALSTVPRTVKVCA